MVRMINGQLGTEMWVAEDRVAEYEAAGHKLAAADTKPAEKPKRPVKKQKKKEVKA